MKILRFSFSCIYLLGTLCCVRCGAVAPGAFFAEGPGNKKEIALTFDDGPGPFTTQVLDILRQYGIKATFFMEGLQVAMRPGLVQKVKSAGHEIGGHTYSHANYFTYKKPDREKFLSDEIEKTEKLLFKVTGNRPYLMRMPNGYARAWVRKVAAEENYVLVNWSFGCDWKKKNAAELFDAYTHHIHSGAIFLMHDGGRRREAMVEALPKIIEEIQKRGYKMVVISELLEVEPLPGVKGSEDAK